MLCYQVLLLGGLGPSFDVNLIANCLIALQVAVKAPAADAQREALESNGAEGSPELIQGVSTAASQELPESYEGHSLYHQLQIDDNCGSPEGA